MTTNNESPARIILGWSEKHGLSAIRNDTFEYVILETPAEALTYRKQLTYKGWRWGYGLSTREKVERSRAALGNLDVCFPDYNGRSRTFGAIPSPLRAFSEVR